MKRSGWLYTMLLLSPFLIVCCKSNDPHPPTLSTLITSVVTDIAATSAASGGSISSDGGSAVTARGVCWNTTGGVPTIAAPKTSDGSGMGNFTSEMIRLLPGTTYYLRAYATNQTGTGYGNVISFSTPQATDIDGNTYHAVTIGTQVWMVENLKVTKYNDGTPIPLVTGFAGWGVQTSGAYCWYNNDASTFKNPYGAIYNWYAANSGKLCPAGWRVATDVDFNTLFNFLGASPGGKLKDTGTIYWNSPNTGATNTSGFTALPGGLRALNGSFYYNGQFGYWWSSSEDGIGGGYNQGLGYQSDGLYGNGGNKAMGYSVRCIRD